MKLLIKYLMQDGSNGTIGVANEQEFLTLIPDSIEWLVVGTEEEEAQIVNTEPREIDARRLRIALNRLGYLTSVEALIAQADKETQINWESSAFIVEDFPLVQGIIATLKLTKANVDEIFELALTLT